MDVIDSPRLESLCPEAKVTLAALCAQRLLDEEASNGGTDENQFALSWLPVFGDIWKELEISPSPARKKRIERHYKAYLDSPYADPQAEDAAEAADNDAAAAATFAVAVYLSGDVKSLRWTIGRLIEGACWRLYLKQGDRVLGGVDIEAENAHPLVQDEVHLVLAALDIVEGSPWSPSLATAVHRLLPDVSRVKG
jgi:hypothetical protein